MKFAVAILSLLAAVAIASPAAVNNNPLEARVDCNHCGCSSAESCTVSCSVRCLLVLVRKMLTDCDSSIAAR